MTVLFFIFLIKDRGTIEGFACFGAVCRCLFLCVYLNSVSECIVFMSFVQYRHDSIITLTCAYVNVHMFSWFLNIFQSCVFQLDILYVNVHDHIYACLLGAGWKAGS